MSGAAWTVRNYLHTAYPATYRQILNPLIINSIPLHTPTSNNTITPQITIDVLTLDDNDGNLHNGTPHYDQINAGFSDHNMAGPPVDMAISVSPLNPPTHVGVVGGPFTNDPFVYTLGNNTAVAANYTASIVAGGTAPLLLNGSAGPISGTVNAGQTAPLSVSVAPGAASLPAGIYTSTVHVQDTTNNFASDRLHRLEIGQVGFTTTPANDRVSG